MTTSGPLVPAAIPGVPRWLAARLPARVVEHLKSPLYRNGYALIVATGATSVLGLLYWVLAARRYSQVDVGRNSALIASMTFLANLAHLNLTNGLNRFVPTSGRSTGKADRPLLPRGRRAVGRRCARLHRRHRDLVTDAHRSRARQPDRRRCVRPGDGALGRVPAPGLGPHRPGPRRLGTGREHDLRRAEDRPARRACGRAAQGGHLRIVGVAADPDRRSDQRARVPTSGPTPRRGPRCRRRAGACARPRALRHRRLLRLPAVDRDHKPPAA